MSDPLADPRARDLLNADPDDVGALAGRFAVAAGDAMMTAAGLDAAQHDLVWTGPAADAFRSAIGQVPVELETVQGGYDAVAQALTVYGAELAGLRDGFTAIVAGLRAAQQAVPPAAAVITDLTGRAFALLDVFGTARDACHAAIAAAQVHAVRRP